MAKDTKTSTKTTGEPHLRPSLQLLTKLGSIIVHFDEYNSPDGREIDKIEAQQRLADPDVQEWIKQMGSLLPLKRVKRA